MVLHYGATPGIVGADFTSGLAPTVYAIDKTNDSLVRIGSPGGSPIPASSGQLTTIGFLGKDTEGLTGLDFTPGGSAFAVLSSATDATSNLYVIDLNTGHATSLGTIGVAETVRDLVVATPGQISVINTVADVTEGDGFVTILVARTGGSWGQVTVDYATTNGSATAGSDYTAKSNNLTWLDGEVGVKNITIPIKDDTVIEGDETLQLTLSNATNGALLITPVSTFITIHERAYDTWKNLIFGNNANIPAIAGDSSNPAHDGIPNLMKYALGMNPNTNSSVGLPINGFSNGHLQLSFTRYATDVQYQVEVSDDLIIWNPGSHYGITADVLNTSVTTDITPLNSPIGWTQVQDNTASTATTKHFMRLKVLLP